MDKTTYIDEEILEAMKFVPAICSKKKDKTKKFNEY